MNFELTEENFNIYAIKHYDNPACKGMAEYNDDLKRFRYLKRLFKKYKSENDLFVKKHFNCNDIMNIDDSDINNKNLNQNKKNENLRLISAIHPPDP